MRITTLPFLYLMLSPFAQAETCENIYMPTECNQTRNCVYDTETDACTAMEKNCSAGFSFNENLDKCEKISCGFHDGVERFYQDQWKKVVRVATQCTRGEGLNKRCVSNGTVKTTDYVIYPTSRNSRSCSFQD